MLLMVGCGYDKRAKKGHPRTRQICNCSLYIESYTVFAEGGAVGGVMRSDYLTDSINFRRYIGTFDEAHEKYFYVCKGDSVYAQKTVFEEDAKNPDASKITVTECPAQIYSLRKLKVGKQFE